MRAARHFRALPWRCVRTLAFWAICRAISALASRRASSRPRGSVTRLWNDRTRISSATAGAILLGQPHPHRANATVRTAKRPRSPPTRNIRGHEVGDVVVLQDRQERQRLQRLQQEHAQRQQRLVLHLRHRDRRPRHELTLM